MEESLLFDRVHEALDVEMPAGAYERLRVALTRKPVRPYRWPAFSTRWSKMGFKFAAGVALIALVAATAAAVIAIHNATSNSAPAGSRMSVSAYKALMQRLYVDPNTTWSNPCDETVHTGCLADATRSVPLLQHWLDGLDRANAPARFAIVDAELKQNLNRAISALTAMEADARAQNNSAVTRDYLIGLYTANWVSVIAPAIWTSQQVTASEYRDIVSATVVHQIEACIASCALFVSSDSGSCVTNGGTPCTAMFDDVSGIYLTFLSALVQNAAPDSLSAKDARLQGDMAQADAVLLTMRLAVAANDQVGINSGVAQLKSITVHIEQDAVAITG